MDKGETSSELDFGQLLRQASDCIRCGRVKDAERAAGQIIEQAPNHAGALHVLGIIAAQRGDLENAIYLLNNATKNDPGKPIYQLHLGLAKQNAGYLNEAVAIYSDLTENFPGYAEGFYNLGNILKDLGRLSEALHAYDRCISINPLHAMAHNNRGCVLSGMGREEEAQTAHTQAININPRYAESYINRSIGLAKLHKYEDALKDCCAAIDVSPENILAKTIKASLLLELNRQHEVVVILEGLIGSGNDNAKISLMYGIALSGLGRHQDALTSCDRSILMDSTNPDAYSARAVVLSDLGRFEESVSDCEMALKIKPDHSDAYANIGAALVGLGRLDDAESALKQAIALNPENASAQNNMSMLMLQKGDYLNGWEKYEWRWKVKDFPSHRRDFHQPLWDGDSLHGKTILLHAEQGLGDTLQFIRYLPSVAEAGGKIIVECQQPLQKLLSGVRGIDEILVYGDPLPFFDVHAPLMSLPRIFRTTLETIPGDVPYLSARVRSDSEYESLGISKEKINIGIVWAGNPKHRNDHNRSLNPALFRPLLELGGINWFSLQVGERACQIRSTHGLDKIVDLAQAVHDFPDTASVMLGLDLVITVDTSMAHLAGALGVPVWVLLPNVADFRWLLGREDSPWYPTARLFRQDIAKDWEGVMKKLAAALKNLAASK